MSENWCVMSLESRLFFLSRGKIMALEVCSAGRRVRRLREPGIQLELKENRLGPGEEFQLNSGQWRFIFLKSGTAYWLDAANPRALAGGEFLIVSPTPRTLIRCSQLGESMLQWFSFEPGSLLGLFSLAEREWIEACPGAAVGPALWLPSTHPLAKEMAALLNDWPQECELVLRGKALVLALRVLTQSMPRAESHRRGAAAKERFDEIISHLPDVELIQRSSHELAQLCGCTPRHFNRLFRMRFGAPTRVRQTELRLLKARQLLEDSKQTIAQVAVSCGYHSLSLFNSLFRRRFGMTPSEWRNQNPVSK